MEVMKIMVKVEGLSDIMFDRFIDHSKDVRPPEQKLYLAEDNQLVLPAENLTSFLLSENPPGCAKWFEGKRGKEYIRMGMSHVFFNPSLIPFKENDNDIFFEDFNNCKFSVYYSAARTRQGNLSIKQEAKPRPLMKLPWSLEFQITLIKNTYIDSTKLYNWFVMGGMQIAIGTYRPRFGRFEVSEWKEI
uniref:Uncharacterized protein n=1 Tax=viral metagenome TaxID=1070528 RepID=A0A6M3LHK2_9ZZZZ